MSEVDWQEFKIEELEDKRTYFLNNLFGYIGYLKGWEIKILKEKKMLAGKTIVAVTQPLLSEADIVYIPKEPLPSMKEFGRSRKKRKNHERKGKINERSRRNKIW